MIDLLSPIAAFANRLPLPPDDRAELEAAAHIISQGTPLQGLFLRDYAACFISWAPRDPVVLPSDENAITSALGDVAGAWYVLLCLARLPQAQRDYALRGIPEEILWDTLRDYLFYMSEYRRVNGHCGIRRSTTSWFLGHVSLRLFALGRLQYEYGPNPLQAYVLQDTDGNLQALARPGDTYMDDGLPQGNGGLTDANPLSATFCDAPDAYIGLPLGPAGLLSRQPVRYKKNQWSLLCGPGDHVVSMHIPTPGEPITPAVCQAAHDRARGFFAKYFPEYQPKLFSAVSWLLAPFLRNMLSENSNIVLFQDSLYRISHSSTHGSFSHFVFRSPGLSEREMLALTPQTSLQRAILERIRAGLPLYCGAGFTPFSIQSFDHKEN